MNEPTLDLVITGGRVMDPRSGFDAVTSVGILDGRIASVGDILPLARRRIDATGMIVAPGFIDIHSHAQSRVGLGLQAQDGVTTALDLESGALPVGLQYAEAEAEGRPINFGYSVSWAAARLSVLADVAVPTRDDQTGRLVSALELFQRNQSHSRWNTISSPAEIDSLLAVIEEGLSEGGIGIGVLLGYAPASGRDEYFRVAQLAAAAGVPVFTHSRQVSNIEPGSSLDGALEVIAAAAGSGAHMHLCHINSTSLRRIDEVSAAIVTAQARGNHVTTEAYPYAISSTGIGAAFLAPEKLDRFGIEPSAITYLPTGKRVENAAELTQLRATDPGGLCLIDFLDGPDATETLVKSFALPGTVVASDAMPMVDESGRYFSGEWPLPAKARAHPRSVGTFARTFGWLVRDLGALTLAEAILRTSTEPAELLAASVPAMKTKGRIQVGFDADLTIFDPNVISDRATPTEIVPSAGIEYVIVSGSCVVDEGRLDRGANAGRAIRTR